MDKVKQVADHVNMILRYIPYIQTNFVLGLDGDMGPEPFELTKTFIDLAPGAFPAYSLLSAFGRAAPMNLDYQRAGRVLPFPFHFLNNNHAMNVRPKNYGWPEFYDGLIDVTSYSFSWKAIARRVPATATAIPKWMNVVRAMSSEGWGRIKYHTTIRRLLDTDRSVRAYMEGETDRAAGRSTTTASAGSWDRCTRICPRAPCTTIRRRTWGRWPRSRRWRRWRCGAAARGESAHDILRLSRGEGGMLPACPLRRTHEAPPIPAQPSASRVRILIQEPTRRCPPRNSKCSSAIKRSPWGMSGAVRCQSRSCWPMAEADIQTPGCRPG